jgi:DNA adenine methylase
MLLPTYSKEQQECYFQLRVNRRGEFNVPPGKYKNPLICDSINLENVSNALAGATILADDYRIVTQNAQKDDFIYLDRPYQPLNNTSYFTAYTSNGFGSEDQVQLAKVYRKLADKGCMVLLSNSYTPFIRRLYSDFSIKEVDVQRAINCKGDKRGGHKANSILIRHQVYRTFYQPLIIPCF